MQSTSNVEVSFSSCYFPGRGWQELHHVAKERQYYSLGRLSTEATITAASFGATKPLPCRLGIHVAASHVPHLANYFGDSRHAPPASPPLKLSLSVF